MDPATESRSIELLEPAFQQRLAALLAACKNRGIDMRVGTSVRGPEAQGRLWCRSRCEEEVALRRSVIQSSAPTMAAYLREEWCGLGPRLTSNLPGQSWHAYGEAADVFSVVGGKALWDGSLANRVALLAAEVGLFVPTKSVTWRRSLANRWHVQLRKEETPLMVRGFCDSWGDVDRMMLKRYS
jgi:hypothetical protein